MTACVNFPELEETAVIWTGMSQPIESFLERALTTISQFVAVHNEHWNADAHFGWCD